MRGNVAPPLAALGEDGVRMLRPPEHDAAPKQRPTTRRRLLRLAMGCLGGSAALAGHPRRLRAAGEDDGGFFDWLSGWSASPPAPQPSRDPVPEAPPAPPYPYEPPWPKDARVLPMLMYHAATSSRIFEAQLAGMLQAGYLPISLHTAARGLRGEQALPEKPVVLTFDDGWKSQYHHVFPILKQYNVPATFFVMPGRHERLAGYMNWQQLEEIARAGLEVEAHTLNHADLPRLARYDWGAVLAEVVLSKRLLEERLGRLVRYSPTLTVARTSGFSNWCRRWDTRPPRPSARGSTRPRSSSTSCAASG